MGSCRFVRYNVMQHGSRYAVFTSWTRAGFIYWREVFSMLAKFYQRHHPSTEQIWVLEGVLRLRGPRCVNATPNRAVRVGNTQSAYLNI
jgi:hypothetical protein